MRQVEDIRARGKLPILVGGTHYYTQSLLFNESLVHLDDALDSEDEGNAKEAEADSDQRWPILAASTPEILAKLNEIDPLIAQRWHPNDRRKIRRSMEIFLQTGRKPSDIYAEQEARRAGNKNQEADDTRKTMNDSETQGNTSSEATGLRFPTLLLWPHVPRPILNSRLDARVDKMLTSGLLDEAKSLHNFSNSLSTRLVHPVDETRGIYAAVGYKEFKPYLNSSTSPSPADSTIADETKLEVLKQEAIVTTKAATRRYAKSQIRWIRIKLVNALADANIQADTALTAQQNRATLYILNASDPSPATWSTQVLEPSARYVSAFLSSLTTSLAQIIPAQLHPPQSNSSTLPDPLNEAHSLGPEYISTLTPLRTTDLGKVGDWQVKTCDVCGISAIREEEWERHLSSGRHKRAEKGVAKRRERDRVLAERGISDQVCSGGQGIVRR